MAKTLREFLISVTTQMNVAGAPAAGRAIDGVTARIEAQSRVTVQATQAVKGYFAILAAQTGPSALIGMMDQWTNINARVRLATTSTEEFNKVQGRLKDIANTTYRSYSEAADMYASTGRIMKELGFTTNTTLDAAETLGLALVAGGSDAEKGASAMDAWGKSMARGAVTSKEFNTLLLQTPRVAQALADGLGKTTRELGDMARAGQLTAGVAVPALISQMGQLRGEVAKMPTEIRDAVGKFRNELLAYVGGLNDAWDASGKLVSGLELASKHLDVIGAAGAAVGVAKLAPAMLAAATAAKAHTVALYDNVVGLRANVEAANAKAAADMVQADMTAVRAAKSLIARDAALEVARADQLAAAAALEQAQAAAKAAVGTEAETAAKRQLAVAAKAAAIADEELVVATTAQTAAAGRARAAQDALNAANKRAAASATLLGTAMGGIGRFLAGPGGLVLMAAAAAGSMLLFRDGTDEATRSLIDLQTPLDQAIAKYKELGEAQKQKVQLDLADEIKKQAKQMESAVRTLTANAFAEGGSNAGAPYREEIGGIQRQYEAGAITIEQASTRIVAANRKLAGSFHVSDGAKREMAEASAAWESSATKLEGNRKRLDDLTSSAKASSSAMAAHGAAAAGAAEGWDEYIAKIEQATQVAGLNAAQTAEIAARAKGYSEDQAKLAGNLTAQQTALTQYNQALAKGDKAQAESIAKTLAGLVDTETSLRRVIDLAGGGHAIIEGVRAAFAKGGWFGAGRTLLDSILGNDPKAVADARARLKAQLDAISAGVTVEKPKRDKDADEQKRTLKALQERIAEQTALTTALEKYGLAADRLTEGEKLVAKLQHDIATETNAATRAKLEQQLALAKTLAGQERANEATREHLKLAKEAVKAEREVTRAQEDRQLQYARELAAVGQSDLQRERNSRLQAIDDEYRHRRQAYEDELAAKRAAGETVDEKIAAARFALFDRLRQQDIESERRYQQQLAAEQGNWVNGAHRAYQNYLDKAADVAGQTDALFSNAFQGMEDSLVKFVTTGKGSFKDLAKSILADLARMEIRILMSKALQAILGGFMGGTTGTTTGTTTIPENFTGPRANGGVFDAGGEITAFARGGVVNSPTLFQFAKGTGLMGEAGPEAIMPLTRGPDGKLGVMAHAAGSAGSAGVTIHQTINVEAGGDGEVSAGQSAEAARAFAGRMKAVALQAIAEEQRPGGSLWRMARA